MVNFYDEEEEENYLAEKMASEELKEIYDLLSKKLNIKTKNEIEYLRKRNAELEKEVTDSIMNYLSISKIQPILERS